MNEKPNGKLARRLLRAGAPLLAVAASLGAPLAQAGSG